MDRMFVLPILSYNKILIWTLPVNAYIINQLIFAIEKCCIYFEVWTEFLNII
jgi:hypothetical protein